MKNLSTALLLAAIIDIMNGMPSQDTPSSLGVTVYASGDCEDTIFSCAGCRAIKVCRPTKDGIVEYKNVTCPPERPYCHATSGTCTETASLECGEIDDEFPCLMKNHYFPDDDCKKYHYCDEKYQSKRFECSGQLVYDAIKERCVPQQDSCGKFDCENNTLRKVKHSKFPRYFAMCQEKGNQKVPLVVGACPPYYQMDAKTQECEPDCSEVGDGNLPNKDNPSGYYSCFETVAPDGKTYVQYNKKICPANQFFDTKLLMCMPQTPKTDHNLPSVKY